MRAKLLVRVLVFSVRLICECSLHADVYGILDLVFYRLSETIFKKVNRLHLHFLLKKSRKETQEIVSDL